MCGMRVPLPFVAVLTLWVALVACHAGPRNYENENDRLRAQVLDLTDQVRTLNAQVDSLNTALAAAEQRQGVSLPEGLHVPRATDLDVSSTSCIILEQGKPTARLYLRTLDARRRFVQTIAEVRLTITATRPGADPVTLATQSFDPHHFDAAYRQGLTGVHYTLLCPLQRLPDPGESVTAAIALHDLQTGLTLQTQTPLRYVPAEPRAADAEEESVPVHH